MNSRDNSSTLSRITSHKDSSSTKANIEVQVHKVPGEGGCSSGEIEKRDTVISCKEALLKLDSATENVLHLFSKLQTMVSSESTSTGPEAHLYDEAAAMLPSIARKVHTIARLTQQSTHNTLTKSGEDVSSFEPFLGTFAENISQRVVEILKKNSVTL